MMELEKKEIKPDIKEIVELFNRSNESGKQFIYATALAVNMLKTVPGNSDKPVTQ